MSPNFDPAPRPALRKAPDANVHPTTHVASAHAGDAILEGRKVAIQATIPKKLRKQLRRSAKSAGVSIDEFVTIALANEIRRRSD
ncbi:MAG: hypothetical protein VX327_05330 [Actinomycetota bacterium]|jgi:hypothetical protein|nr:hypothetical protein [Micrococcales bacterium]MEE3089088.1 hypothetical protein [Actinomycetota bacterium]|tara:strand:+ start:2745 stop:2999 length:255 start_codon:yes stop_codon:yes gene_type:complete